MAEVTIPIGPQHPALKEPASFKVTLDGEKVVRAAVRLGYNHRGIEKACEARTWIQCLYLLERICGICSHSHSTCYITAVEELGGIEVPARATWIRTIVAELERIHSHLLWLGVAGHEVGFDTLLMYSWRDREVVMDLLAAITGNRVNYGINTIGGVRRDISADQIVELRRGLDILEERTKYYVQVAIGETTLLARLQGVGALSKEEAIRYGALGPTARASGVDIDARRDDPYLAYAHLQFKVITSDACDVFGRAVVRVLETLESISMIRQLLDTLPEGNPIPSKMPRRIKAGEAVSRYEAPRGEDIHFVRSGGGDKPERVKVRAPTMANLPATCVMIEKGYLADAPLVMAAIDPCFSCTDRGIELVQTAGTDRWDWERLRQHGIDFYRARGIDFSSVKLAPPPSRPWR